MGTRLKMRVCTWNVGNAQPPQDLTPWLGFDQEDYDIIVIGAQEANYGAEKTSSPTSVASPASTADFLNSREGAGMTRSKSSLPAAPTQPSLASSGKRRTLARAVRVAKDSWRYGKQKLKAEPVPQPAQETLVGVEELESVSEDMIRTPRPSRSFPLRHTDETRRMPFLQGPSVDELAAETSGREILRSPTGRAFAELDESLLVRRMKSAEKSSDANEDELPPITASGLHESFWGDSEDYSSGTTHSEVESVFTDPTPSNFSSGFPTGSDSTSYPPLRHIDDVVTPLADNDSGPMQDVEPRLEESPNVAASGKGRKFSQLVESIIPAQYQLIAKHHLMEIKLLVFVHERHKSRVMRTECVAEATGIGNVVGNKGGVAVKLTLDDTSFCFISSHLAAHEGAKFLQQRNDDVVEIMRNLERNKVHGLPVIHQHHHVFWMGDLNYRLDLKRVLPAAVTWSHQERWCYVIDLIARKRYDQVSQLDELIHEMELEHVFAGFVEGRITFPPTFKMARSKPYSSYQSLRVPSYCDRILWHSLPLHKNHIKLREYNSVPNMHTSDHKPVYAIFDLVIPRRITAFPLPAPRDALKCTLDFLKLRVHGLYEKRGADADDSPTRYFVLEDGALAVTASTDYPPSTPPPTSTAGQQPLTFPSPRTPHSQPLPANPTYTDPLTTTRTPRRRMAPRHSMATLTTTSTSPTSQTGRRNRQAAPPRHSLASLVTAPIATPTSPASHTRRVVHADFHGNGLFVKERPHRAEIPLRDGHREGVSDGLPVIALRPVQSLADLMYKYVTVVFTRLGSRQGSSCVLPIAHMLREPGRHRVRVELALTKYGAAVATVEVEVELVVSKETWVDTRNQVVRVRR